MGCGVRGFTVRVQETASVAHARLLAICRANMAHIRQTRLDSGVGFQIEVLHLFSTVPSSLESGEARV